VIFPISIDSLRGSKQSIFMFDLEMKSRRMRILATGALLLAAAAIIGWIQYRKIVSVHKVALLSTSESFSDLHQNFFFIAQSVLESDLVVRGTIIDPDSTVQASPNQTEVAYPQGWAVARVRIDKRFSGRENSLEIAIVPARWWPTPVVGNSFLKPFAKNEEYLFFLTENDKLSRWCNTTVFAHSGQSPIPLPKSENKASVPPQ